MLIKVGEYCNRSIFDYECRGNQCFLQTALGHEAWESHGWIAEGAEVLLNGSPSDEGLIPYAFHQVLGTGVQDHFIEFLLFQSLCDGNKLFNACSSYSYRSRTLLDLGDSFLQVLLCNRIYKRFSISIDVSC